MANKALNSEYSAAFQQNLLGIDHRSIEDPVLVLGCGTTGNLVHALNGFGRRACGIDPQAENTDTTRQADFLNTDYGSSYWGTILSPLAFIQSFAEALSKGDGQDIAWVKCYRALLNALKPGGAFIYAPSLPHIEDMLPADQFTVERTPIRGELNRTKIIRK
ncbi:MAG: class I SAM-dependent methyltransferase [Eubacterium sp.]|nr:class I SAM-dependent methyltransferase [Eubacterium sp.]